MNSNYREIVNAIIISEKEVIELCIHKYDASLCFLCGNRICSHPHNKNPKYCKICGRGKPVVVIVSRRLAFSQ